jgi:hypothetical protein
MNPSTHGRGLFVSQQQSFISNVGQSGLFLGATFNAK